MVCFDCPTVMSTVVNLNKTHVNIMCDDWSKMNSNQTKVTNSTTLYLSPYQIMLVINVANIIPRGVKNVIFYRIQSTPSL